jgi:GPH family glycoside/pentoside/hexuronide:cation symporter
MSGQPQPNRILTLRDKVLYSSGYFGVSLLSGLFILWANYRYGELFTGGQKALVGIALLVARFVDAPVDPLVGWWSDRVRARCGRRPFIAWGALPLVALFALVWAPPAGQDNAWNIVWLLGIGTGFFVLFSIVTNPYLAMLPDIARSPGDRVSVSAWVAAFGLAAQIAAMIGGSALAGKTGSFGLAVGVTSLVALVFLLLPLLVREATGAAEADTRQLSLGTALRQTLANGPFRIFLFSKCLFWIGVHSVLTVSPFFVRGVLRVSDEHSVQTETALLLGSAAAPAFVWFIALKPLAARVSKRRLSLMGLAALALLSSLLVTVGLVPFDPLLWSRLIMGLGSFAVAALFSIPNAILAEIVDVDERVTGIRREAIFFGAQGLFVKAAWGGSSLIVMAAQGAFHDNPALAVRVSLAAVAIVAAMAFAVFLRFPEDAELRRMAEQHHAGA